MVVRELNGTDFGDLAVQILKAGHEVRFQAHGGSMLPFINDGDILWVSPLAGSRVRLGEVVLVMDGEGKLLAHRVVKTGRRNRNLIFLIKGDACSAPDGWFGPDNILGRVEIVEHGTQRIEFTSPAHLWRAKIWAKVAPCLPKISWLPEHFRKHVRRLLLGRLIPD